MNACDNEWHVALVISGECCVALHSIVANNSESFETCLTHRGEEMGSIRGQIKVYIPLNKIRSRERSYGESHLSIHFFQLCIAS